MKPTVIETSAGGIVFRRQRSCLEFLLLQSIKGHWSFPKGHPESHESLVETALREVHEETHLKNLNIISDFCETFVYEFEFPRDFSKKTVYLFLMQGEGEVRISREHVDCHWFPFQKALVSIQFKEQRDTLKKAYVFLKDSFLIKEK